MDTAIDFKLTGTVKTTPDNTEAVYTVDITEADQGNIGSGNSLKDIITAIGTEKMATIFFPHYISNGNNSTYTFSTNLDLSSFSNLNIKIEKGAILFIDNAITLTLYNPENIITSKNAQIFSGNGDIAFSTSGEIYPEWWGIDGIADEVQINQALSSVPGACVILRQNKLYTIAASIVIDADYTTLKSTGPEALIITSADIDAMVISAPKCFVEYIRLTKSGEASTKAGLKLVGGASICHINEVTIYLFSYCFEIYADTDSTLYNRFYNLRTWGAITYDIYIHSTSSGAANENQFVNGDLHGSETSQLIRIEDGGYNPNNNKFMGISLEGGDATKFAVHDEGMDIFTLLRMEVSGYGFFVENSTGNWNICTRIGMNHLGLESQLRPMIVVKDGYCTTDVYRNQGNVTGQIGGGITASTTIDAQSLSGQKVVSIADTSNLKPMDTVVLDEGNANEEWAVIDTISDGVSITLYTELVNTHNIGVTVIKYGYFYGIKPFYTEVGNIGGTYAFSEFYVWNKKVLRMSKDGDLDINRRLGIGIDLPLSPLHMSMPTDNLEIVDADEDGGDGTLFESSTLPIDGWVKIKINGVVHYIPSTKEQP